VTAGEQRVPHARWIVAAAALVVCTALLWISRTYTFYLDEWTFIQDSPAWSIAGFFKPHNEHPAMLLRAVYWTLLNTVGVRSYLPYMAVLLALHATNVLLLFELIRRRAGDAVGLGAALLLLVLGAGWDDFLWAFQIAWLASLTLGLGVLLLLQGPRSPARLGAAALLLAASLAFSGIGLVFAVAAVVDVALTPERRGDLLWFVPVGLALGAYYLVFGPSGNHPTPGPTLANAYLVPPYAVWGLGASVAGLAGAGGWFGPPLLAAAIVVLAWTWRRRPPDPPALGVLAGLLSFYVVAGATRAQLGIEQSAASRYDYIAAALWLVLLADAARNLPWRGLWRPALVACLVLACLSSGGLLVRSAVDRTATMERQMADLQALAAERRDPCLNPHGAADPLVMPVETDPALYYRAIDRYGDPAAGRAITDVVDYDNAIRNLRRPGC
jgi:hypothetical protein